MNELLLLLKKFFGYTRFRPMQEEIIQRIVAGKDALVLMPLAAESPSVSSFQLSIYRVQL